MQKCSQSFSRMLRFDIEMYFTQRFSVLVLPSFQSNQKIVGMYMNLLLQNNFWAFIIVVWYGQGFSE